MRLDQFLCANLNISRVQAGRLIRTGAVVVSGAVCIDRGFKITPEASVFCDGQALFFPKSTYIMFNKPVGVICDRGNATYPSVFDRLERDNKDMHVAGRLDVDTTGLVLITDDGAWSHRITAPKSKCAKRYRVTLADPIASHVIDTFAQGIVLKSETKATHPAQLDIVTPHEVLLTLREGKYHQVKRMFAAVGNRVVGLHREAIGPLELDPTLAVGQYRALTPEELQQFVLSR